MDKFIPFEKLSKKEQRRLNASRRNGWEFSPVTRKPENPKAYNRRKAQKWSKNSDSVPCASSLILFSSEKLSFEKALV